MADHGHCRNPGCYNRIQFADSCSRCGGSVTPGGPGCCSLSPDTPESAAEKAENARRIVDLATEVFGGRTSGD